MDSVVIGVAMVSAGSLANIYDDDDVEPLCLALGNLCWEHSLLFFSCKICFSLVLLSMKNVTLFFTVNGWCETKFRVLKNSDVIGQHDFKRLDLGPLGDSPGLVG